MARRNFLTSATTSFEPAQLKAARAKKQRRAQKVRLKVPYAPALCLIPFPENCAEEWADFSPMHMAGTMSVSEKSGSEDGPIFCFWIGDQDPESVIDEVAEFIAGYDLSGIRFVRALPNAVLSSPENFDSENMMRNESD